MGWRAVVRERSGANDHVPTFLCIDVEPNEFQVPRSEPGPWTAYDDTVQLIDGFRAAFARASGVTPRFGWYFRMDPQIALSTGRAEYAVDAIPGRVERLASDGDVFGIHMHALRWSDARGLWVDDFSDAGWVAHCIDVSADAYARVFGSGPLRFRFGARFLSDRAVAQLEQLGVRVELTIEPGRAPVTAGPADHPIQGPIPGYRHALREPYRPSPSNFLEATRGRNGGKLVMVPISSTLICPGKPRWWQAARALRFGLRPPPLSLRLYRSWPSPQEYWDLVSREIDSMERPYLALTMRTWTADFTAATRVRELLEHLCHHPLAERLRFIDPLEFVAPLDFVGPEQAPSDHARVETPPRSVGS